MEPIAWAYYWLKSLHTSINIRLVLILEVVSKIGAEQALINLSPKWKVFLKFVEYSQGAGRLKIGCDVISRHNSNPIFWLNKKKILKSTLTHKTQVKKKFGVIFAFRHAGCPLPRWLPENFNRLAPCEYLTNFKKTFHFGIRVFSTTICRSLSMKSRIWDTLMYLGKWQ